MKRMYCDMAVICFVALTATSCGQQQECKTIPVKVRVIKIESVNISCGQEFSGTVEEATGTTLSFPVAGTVRQIRVQEGQHVRQGELIAVLDETSLHSAYDAAAATLEQAEDAYLRMKQLHDAGSLPEIQWVEAQSRLRQAQSAERIARKNLTDGKLYAPFAGVIAAKEAESGQNVMSGMPVARLVTVNRVKVCISVPENEISHIKTGQPVNVNVPALDGKTFSGKIVEKGIVANPLSRSYEVKALIDNPSGELMPGMICTLNIVNGNTGTAIILPTSVIQTDERNRTFVWVNDNERARKKVVQTGTLIRNGVMILSGISTGDRVIVEGQQKVSEGMEITEK